MASLLRRVLAVFVTALGTCGTVPALGQEEDLPKAVDKPAANPKFFKDDQWVLEHSKLTELLAIYGVDHPLVIEARTRVSAIESMIDEGTTIGQPVDREIAIEVRRLQLLRVKYGNDHPMVRSVESRLESLRQSLSTQDASPGDSLGSQALRKELDQERMRLSELRENYGDGHPLVQQSKNRIGILVKEQRLLRQMGSNSDAHRNQIHQLALEKAHLAELRSRLGNSHPDVRKSQSKIEVLEKAMGLDGLKIDGDLESPDDIGLSEMSKQALVEERRLLTQEARDLQESIQGLSNKKGTDAVALQDAETKLRELAVKSLRIDRWITIKEMEVLQQQIFDMRRRLEEEQSEIEDRIRSRLKEWMDSSP